MTNKTKSIIKIALLALPLLLMGCGDPRKIGASPTPTNAPPITQEVLDKMIREAVAKAVPAPASTPQPRFTPDPSIIANISEDTKLREGIKLLSDADGSTLLRVHRKDNEPVTKGLTAENIVIEFYQKPILTNTGDGKWEVVLKENAAAEITPTP